MHFEWIFESGTSSEWMPKPDSQDNVVDVQPVAWCNEYDSGRTFYTGMCHFEDNIKEPEITMLIINAIK